MREQAGCVVASGSKKSKHCSTKSFTIAKKSYKIEPYYETTGDTEGKNERRRFNAQHRMLNEKQKSFFVGSFTLDVLLVSHLSL